jgi:hypothetical protein
MQSARTDDALEKQHANKVLFYAWCVQCRQGLVQRLSYLRIGTVKVRRFCSILVDSCAAAVVYSWRVVSGVAVVNARYSPAPM